MKIDESFISTILARAKEEPTEFEPIYTWQEYIQLRITAFAFKALIRTLNRLANRLLKKYCKTIKTHSADVNLLYAYREVALAIVFYKKELQHCKDTIYTFEDERISCLWR